MPPVSEFKALVEVQTPIVKEPALPQDQGGSFGSLRSEDLKIR